MSDIMLSGVTSGLDWEALIEKLMAVDRKPLLELETRQKTNEEKKNAWKDINTRLYNLQTKAQSLKSRETFYSKRAECSDTQVLTATATSAVPVGAYTVEVVQLARAHTVASATQASSTEALNLVDPSVTAYTVINGKTVAIESQDSLTSIRDKINGTPDISVTASIVQVSASEYRLVITAKETGSASAITFADDQNALVNLGVLIQGETTQPNTVQEAKDAVVVVNSISITRSTNTITDAVGGLTLQLKQEGQTVTVTVSNHVQKAIDAIKAFVDQYNSAEDFMASKMTYDKEKKLAGPLLGDSTLAGLRSMLRQKVTAAVPGMPANLNSVAAIGLTTGAYGTSTANKLVLDEAKLREQLEENLDDVARLFGANPTNVALATSGATASALDGLGNPNESSPASVYGAANAINGDVVSDRWGTAGGGWMDGTEGVYPDILEVDFGSVKTIDQINVWTLNSTAYPASSYGIKDYTIQYFDGSSWVDIEAVTGNTAGLRIHSFDPVNTQKIRVNVSAVNGAGDYTRIVEVEAFQYDEGIGASIYRVLKGYTESGGVLPRKQKTLEEQNKRISDRIERAEARLAMREENLRRQFIAMETAVARLKNQGNWLTSQINLMSQNWLGNR
ncbi:MAG: flagellar filament capping protein FliD [Firmicutes bacterium]|jgi:flagellar hook-associated protein 2|nr:flagellar filament capping protein FliD [Bacillota bacterium]